MDSSCSQALVFLTTLHGSETVLRTFWGLESLGITDQVEGESLDNVAMTFIKVVNDRYRVRLRWKPDVMLSNNINVKRLNNLVKKLEKNSRL